MLSMYNSLEIQKHQVFSVSGRLYSILFPTVHLTMLVDRKKHRGKEKLIETCYPSKLDREVLKSNFILTHTLRL